MKEVYLCANAKNDLVASSDNVAINKLDNNHTTQSKSNLIFS